MTWANRGFRLMRTFRSLAQCAPSVPTFMLNLPTVWLRSLSDYSYFRIWGFENLGFFTFWLDTSISSSPCRNSLDSST